MELHPPAEYGDRIAPIYDDLYAPEGAYRVDDTVATLVELAEGNPVLELGIGTGRIALPLVEAGVEVRGVDASPAMVERLRAKPGGEAIPVEIADFGAADFGTDLALVFVAFNTFYALQDQQRQLDCFAAVATALRPGGRFVVSAFVPDIARFDRGQRTSVLETGIDRVILDTAVHHPVEQRVEATHIVIADGRADLYPVALRYIWPSEFDLMGRMVGLELEHRWGGWDQSPFTNESGAHVSVWQKPG